jgi:cell division protein FtsZ
MASSSALATRPRHNTDPPASIAVVGIGGGGCNAVMQMATTKTVPGVEYICVNTDVKSLQLVEGVAKSIRIGERLTKGMGAGGIPEVGARAAGNGKTALRQAIRQADLVFLAVGMGGGTGTGAAPVVADIAKLSGALVIGVVTTPFAFEGTRRQEIAHSGIAVLRGKVDNLIVIHNDQLLELFQTDVSMEAALHMANEAVMHGILSVAELVNVPGAINVDLADVKSIMQMPGQALMAIGEGQGPGAPLEAARAALTNPLLDLSHIDDAKGVLYNVSGGPSMTLGEVNAAGQFISSLVDPGAMIFFGMAKNHTAEDKVHFTLIATGIPEAYPSRFSYLDIWTGTSRQ